MRIYIEWTIAIVIIIILFIAINLLTSDNNIVEPLEPIHGSVEDIEPEVSVVVGGDAFGFEADFYQNSLGEFAMLDEFLENEIECLALNIYHEVRADNYAGKFAVSDVVLNRVQDPRYPNTVCDVVRQGYLNPDGSPKRDRCQFSWYCDGRSDDPRESAAFQESLSIARNLMQFQTMRGISDGATHYHAYTINPYWVRGRGMISRGRIGDHRFYQWLLQ